MTLIGRKETLNLHTLALAVVVVVSLPFAP